MAAQQTSYSLELVKGYAGDLADSRDCEIRGLRNVTGAEVAYGIFVAHSSTDELAFIALASGKYVAGILINRIAHEQTTTGLPDKEMGAVLQKGRAWIVCENGSTPGQPLHVRYAAGAGGSVIGAARSASVSMETIQIVNGEWLTVSTAGNIAIASVNMPATIVVP